jgi:hypothetical protein
MSEQKPGWDLCTGAALPTEIRECSLYQDWGIS